MAVDNRTGQYSAVASLVNTWKPSWLPDDEALRVAAYRLYQILYNNDVGEIKLTIRGDEDYPIYIPSAKRMINTYYRYVAREASLAITAATPEQRQAALDAFDKLFKREKFWTQMHHEKKNGGINGDWVLMLIGNPDKPEGTRISIATVDPSTYFAIWNPEDKKDRWGASIMEEVTIDDKIYIKVQTWLNQKSPEHPNYLGPGLVASQPVDIAYSSIIYETDNFKDPQQRKAFRIDIPLALLPGITSVPLYHFRTNADQNSVYGISHLRGIERIFLAVNQTATDQDVALAMAGLGVYAADSSPVDAQTGEATDWILGPKRVVEVPEKGIFQRVSGVPSVDPTIDHMEWIQKMAHSTLGVNDISMGDADVAVAESGIALALRMAPLLDSAGEEDLEIIDVLRNFLFDLATQWFPVYERVQFGPETVIDVVMGDKLPTDRAAMQTALVELWTNQLVSREWVWDQLVKMGLDIDPAVMAQQIDAGGGFSADPEGDRLAAEAEGVTDGGLE